MEQEDTFSSRLDIAFGLYIGFFQKHTTLHTTAGLLLKLSRVGPGQFLDGRSDAAGSGVGGPVGGTLSSGLKNIPMPQGSDWGHCPVLGAVFRMGR